MATKGVLINCKNPEKYYCLRYGFVKRIKYIEACRDYDASLLVFFSKHEVKYTDDGFFSTDKHPTPSLDLLLVEDIEKVPYEHRKRKVIDFKILPGYQGENRILHPGIFCLTNDGKMYGIVIGENQEKI